MDLLLIGGLSGSGKSVALAALEDSGYYAVSNLPLAQLGGLLAPLVQSRVDYQEAGRRGRGVTEVNPHGHAADEMRTLWASLRRRIGRAKGKGPARKAA